MQISLAAIGRLKDGPERQLYARFTERVNNIGRQFHIGPIELIEMNESKASSKQQRQTQEAQYLQDKLAPQTYIIALDERGKSLTSKEFSKKLLQIRDETYQSTTFIIGGPDGLCPTIKNKAVSTLSLSNMTLPHGLARIFLVEQIYRALTIIAGHPYHRD